jgi:hypothetical protein
VHARYVMSTKAMRTIPEAALPRLPVGRLAEAIGHDDSAPLPEMPAGILSDFGAGGGSRTPDLARMNQASESTMSAFATACNPRGDEACTMQSACFPVLPDDSSGSVMEKRAERSDPPLAAETDARQQVRPEVAPPTVERESSPSTSDDAIKLAIKLAVDAGEYERAAALLDVAKRTTKPGSVTPIDSARGRDRER